MDRDRESAKANAKRLMKSNNTSEDLAIDGLGEQFEYARKYLIKEESDVNVIGSWTTLPSNTILFGSNTLHEPVNIRPSNDPIQINVQDTDQKHARHGDPYRDPLRHK